MGSICLIILSSLVIISSLCTLNTMGSAIPTNCEKCEIEADCDQDPGKVCKWGETRDYCNRRVCAKGPGEICGDPMTRMSYVMGDCGEGMMCKDDNKCYGCSIQTMQCY